MIQELQDIFPLLSQKQIWRLLLTIKMRYKKYGKIGLSRLEGIRFGISERQMQSFITYLRDLGAINKIGMVKSFRNIFKCNVYSLKKWFSDLLEEVREFVKKEFEYIDPVLYIKSRFAYKQKYGKIKFEVAGNKYIIHLRGKFKGKIYGVSEKVIINPLKLG